jgi:ABC-type lipoprotein release transport system permease subunit
VAAPVLDGLERTGAAENIAAGTVTELDVAGTRVSAFALDNERGFVQPDLLEGRAARAVDEIVLGTKTLEVAGAEVGDRVRVTIAGTVVHMRIVGRAIFPDIADNGSLGRGAQITFSALLEHAPDAPSNVVHIQFAPGVDATAVVERLRDATTPLPVIEAEPPADLTSFGRVDNLPVFVAGAMLLVAAAVLIHTMLTSIRRRRREFAILETLGWARRHVGTTVAVQATTFGCVALLVGVPLGLAAGRFAWGAVATSLGVPFEPATSAAALVAAIVGILLLANLAALFPAWLARRTRPATVLRAE